MMLFKNSDVLPDDFTKHSDLNSKNLGILKSENSNPNTQEVTKPEPWEI